MSYDIRVWDHPPDLPTPTKIEEVESLADALWKRRPGPNPKIIAFAERITAKYPSQAQAYAQKPRREDFTWIGDTAGDARREERGIFSFSVNLAPDPAPIISCIVEAANALALTVLDEQIGVLWLPWGHVIGPPGEDYEESWAASSMKLFTKEDVPRTEASMSKALAAGIEEVLRPQGFKRMKSISGWPRWEAATKVGTFVIELYVNKDSLGAAHFGYDWDLWIDIINPEAEAAARSLLHESELKRPTCHFRLGELDGPQWGRVCSPETMRGVPRLASQVLIPLLARLSTLGALDEFMNEGTASSVGDKAKLDTPILPHMNRQSLDMAFSLKPVIVAWLAKSPRFEAVVAAKRSRSAEPDEFDVFITRLRAEMLPIV